MEDLWSVVPEQLIIVLWQGDEFAESAQLEAVEVGDVWMCGFGRQL